MSADTAILVLAAGSGHRLAAGRAKAFVSLAGQPIYQYSLETLARLTSVERVVLVVPADRADQAELGPMGTTLPRRVSIAVIAGGTRRRDSVRAGLGAVGGAEYVLIHDAARALVSATLAERVLAGARAHDAAIPVLPQGDALVRTDGAIVAEEVPRQGIAAVQTPQGFRTDLLLRAHDAAPADWDAPDDGAMVRRLGHPVAVVAGETGNFKITYPGDVEWAERLLGAQAGGRVEERVGYGWDVHPLAADRSFPLVGVEVSSEFGPVGHSDGDPLAHAVADALLGAAALGDLGTLFPDDDPQWAGASGTHLLRRTVERLRLAGWAPRQVDAVLIADRPKIAPVREAIRAALADALELPIEQVWLKGKRTEGLGGLAQGRGVACHAIVRIARLAGR